MLNEIVIISGKGGTGKTSVTAAFAALAGRSVLADCDVDAADLHLVMAPVVRETHEFRSAKSAVIDRVLCLGCGQCESVCRFDALERLCDEQGPYYTVDDVSCEGCAVCVRVCPTNAITMEQPVSGYHYVSDTRYGRMVHAHLLAARENSGKLVTIVRKSAREQAKAEGLELLLVDGPPGIGCPVIASLTGATRAVAVCEPTVSGIHDLERVAQLTRHFGMQLSAIINKEDINPEKADEIREYAVTAGIDVLGSIPYDSAFTQAQNAGRNVIEADPDSGVSMAIRAIWDRLRSAEVPAGQAPGTSKTLSGNIRKENTQQ